jgi:glycosyltransferase involved in cell wall biosynthesis
MKTVCMVVQNYYDMDIRVRRKAEALIAAGYSVDVLALRSSSSDPKSYSLAGVSVETIALGKKRGSLLRYIFEYAVFFIWAFLKVSNRAKQRRYAVVEVNNLPDFLVFAGAYAKWNGARIVFDMHEITPEFYMSKYGIEESSILIKFLKWIEKLSFEFADHVLTINEPITQLLVNRGLSRTKATEIMNAVDESLFETIPEQPDLADQGGGQQRFIMMYHGTLTNIYGLDIAIEAFGLARREMPGAQFWILGNGPEKASLEAQVKKLALEKEVRFVGSVRPEAVPQWLKRCDAGVLATRCDVFLDLSFSNKLSEYIIMDKAVIASRLKAIRYYFDENALAYFEPGNAPQLASEMIRLYSHPELRSNLAEQALKEYKPISWEVMKHRYLQLIGSFVPCETKGQGRQQTEFVANAN